MNGTHQVGLSAATQEALVHVARQPIFDASQNVVAYELLYRSSTSNSYDSSDGTTATLDVIRNAFLVLGPQLIGTRKAFINFNWTLLQNRTALSLNPATTVIEILEDVQENKDVLDACEELKQAGYTLALDDFVMFQEGRRNLLSLADIIKADFRQMSPEERQALVRSTCVDCQFLAEKVETHEEFEEAKRAGYTLFQGYFFGKPVIMSANSIPGNKINYLRMLSEINRPELDFPNLDKIIKQDTYLSYTLLNYMNSAYFGFRVNVGSIRQALALLGEKEIIRWASLVIMTFIGADKPSEVSVSSLVRAKLCEMLAPEIGLADRASELFMMGMFSMIDVLIGRPMEEIIEKMNFSGEVKTALLRGGNRHGDLLNLVVAYEKGEWQEATSYAQEIPLDESLVPGAYRTAVEWAEQIFGMQSPKAT